MEKTEGLWDSPPGCPFQGVESTTSASLSHFLLICSAQGQSCSSLYLEPFTLEKEWQDQNCHSEPNPATALSPKEMRTGSKVAFHCEYSTNLKQNLKKRSNYVHACLSKMHLTFLLASSMPPPSSTTSRNKTGSLLNSFVHFASITFLSNSFHMYITLCKEEFCLSSLFTLSFLILWTISQQ